MGSNVRQVRQAAPDLPHDRLGPFGPGDLAEAERYDELRQRETQRQHERQAQIDQPYGATNDSSDSANHPGAGHERRLPTWVLVGAIECFQRVEVEAHVGAGEARIAGRDERLSSGNHPESVVGHYPARKGSNPGQPNKAQCGNAAKAIARPARRHLEHNDAEVVEPGQGKCAVQVESGPGEQHQHNTPWGSRCEDFVESDESQVAFEGDVVGGRGDGSASRGRDDQTATFEGAPPSR